MGTGKNKCLNSNLGLCMCIHEQNRKQQFMLVDPVYGPTFQAPFCIKRAQQIGLKHSMNMQKNVFFNFD